MTRTGAAAPVGAGPGVTGVIADDVTGATDVAVALRRNGLRTYLSFGVPDRPATGIAAEAAVVALKTRMIAPAAAVEQSLRALAWLRRQGAQRFYFKYCSTFDSTGRGNIGPVLDALADALGAEVVVTTPSSPEHGRTQYGGYLFVGDVLLAESHMRDHPVTPMRDSNLPRLLRAQTSRTVGLLRYRDIVQGEQAIGEAIAAARRDGTGHLLADAVTDADLLNLGRAIVDQPLTAGAAGLAGGIAATLAARIGLAADRPDRGAKTPSRTPAPATAEPKPPDGPAVVLAGSCSARTLEQLAHLRGLGRPAYFLDVAVTPDADSLSTAALDWYDALSPATAPLIYSSVEPQRLQTIQAELGSEPAAAILESATARIARGLAQRGVKRFITAGGETSGAVVAALDVEGGLVGAEAARGVPWIHTPDGLSLLLKSGNFGHIELLAQATEPTP